jgi:hypothetical protein
MKIAHTESDKNQENILGEQLIEEKYIDKEKYQKQVEEVKKNNKEGLFYGSIVLVFFSFFFFYDNKLVSEYKIFKEGKLVKGIVEHKLKRRNMGLYETFEIVVNYHMDKKKYRETIWLDSKRWSLIQEKNYIDLYYHKSDPTKVRVSNTKLDFFFTCVEFVWFIVFLLSLLITLYFFRFEKVEKPLNEEFSNYKNKRRILIVMPIVIYLLMGPLISTSISVWYLRGMLTFITQPIIPICFVGAFFCLFSMINLYRDLKDDKKNQVFISHEKSRSVHGKVKSISVIPKTSFFLRALLGDPREVLYEYVVNSKKHKKKISTYSLSVDFFQLKEGNDITIYYNLDDPSQSVWALQ